MAITVEELEKTARFIGGGGIGDCYSSYVIGLYKKGNTYYKRETHYIADGGDYDIAEAISTDAAIEIMESDDFYIGEYETLYNGNEKLSSKSLENAVFFGGRNAVLGNIKEVLTYRNTSSEARYFKRLYKRIKNLKLSKIRLKYSEEI